MVTTHVALGPLHAPLHPRKVDPVAGVASNTIAVPEA